MSQESNLRRSKVINKKSIKGSGLEGIVEIESPEALDSVVGGSPYGPQDCPPPPPPPPPPPTTYPGQPPLPNSPAWGPYQQEISD